MSSSSPSAEANSAARAEPHRALHRVFWRVHFWAGLVTAPLVLVAAVTGLLYVFSPQIEARLHGRLDRVPVDAAARSLDEQVAAAREAQPGATLRAIVPAHAPGDSTQVLMAPDAGEHAGHVAAGHDAPSGRIVYVNPYTAEVLGSLAEGERFKAWSRKLHSSYQQGAGWRWLIELAASWMLVMLATGLYLWWPRSPAAGGRGWRALWPRLGQGRATWRDLHASIGLAMGGVLLVVLVTGLTWSRHAGENFRALQEALQQTSPKPPKTLQSAPLDGRIALSLQTIYDTARAQAPALQMQLTPPQGERGTWRAENVDRSQPLQRFVMLLDAGSGQVLYRSGWEALPLLPRATAVGIPFHRGEFGWWNQALLALAALAAIFSVVSGVVMWWQRRPPRRVGAPPVALAQVRAVPWPLWLLAAAMAVAMPVFGLSAALFLTLELLAAAWRRPARPEPHSTRP